MDPAGNDLGVERDRTKSFEMTNEAATQAWRGVLAFAGEKLGLSDNPLEWSPKAIKDLADALPSGAKALAARIASAASDGPQTDNEGARMAMLEETNARLRDELAKAEEENRDLAETLRVIRRNRNPYFRLSPSSVAPLAPCEDIETACLAILAANVTNACMLTQCVSRLSHMLGERRYETNTALVDMALHHVVGSLDLAVNQSATLDDVGFLLVAVLQASRAAVKSSNFKHAIEERLGEHHTYFSLDWSMEDLIVPDFCEEHGRIWESPDAGLVGVENGGLLLVDFEYKIIYHTRQIDAEVLAGPDPSGPPHLKFLTPASGGQDSIIIPLSVEEWAWWTNGC